MAIFKAMSNNKIICGIILTLFSLLMVWGIWVTNGSFETGKKCALFDKSIEVIGKDIEGLQKGQKEIQGELKEQREMIHTNQTKILEKLTDISKSVKRRGE